MNTYVNVWKPDKLACLRMQQNVISGLVAQQMVDLQPGVSPIQPQSGFQRHKLEIFNKIWQIDFG